MITVITPLHEIGNRFIEATYESLCAQSFRGWRWHILENNGGHVPRRLREDERVRVLTTLDARGPSTNIGFLKHVLCNSVETEVVVELDCDDLLRPDALKRIAVAFKDGADFVYSDFAEFKDDGEKWEASWKDYPYGSDFGWSHYNTNFMGVDLYAMHAPPVTAHNIRFILWCPNHVRAWTKAFYDKVGGHDVRMKVCDDHDLIMRMFLAGGEVQAHPAVLVLLSCPWAEHRFAVEC